jgi:hypothetical protein
MWPDALDLCPMRQTSSRSSSRLWIKRNTSIKSTVWKLIVAVMFSVVILWAVWQGRSSTATAQSAQPTNEADFKAVKERLVNREKQSWEAWKNRDGKFFQEFLSDDHVEVGVGGISTKAEIVAFVASPACIAKSYSVDAFELTMFDANTALLTYRAAQDTTCNGATAPSPVWTSSLYIRREDRWFNAFYQQTQARK